MTSERPDSPDQPEELAAAASGLDISVPHSARIWNYWLGGKDNYAADRAAGDAWVATFPGILDVARASRDFLIRSIRYLVAEAGIRQFLDIGTGLPTADSTHQVAQQMAPAARIVYVDNDPMVLAHARALLVSAPEGVTAYVHADLRNTGTIMTEAATTLDFAKPTALILSAIMGHVTDIAEARSIVRSLMDALPSGSYLSLNDGTGVIGGEQHAQASEDYNQTGAIPYVQRTPAEIASFFDGLELLEPGVVSCPRWRPDDRSGEEPAEVDVFGGLARKP